MGLAEQSTQELEVGKPIAKRVRADAGKTGLEMGSLEGKETGTARQAANPRESDSLGEENRTKMKSPGRRRNWAGEKG